MGTKIAMNKIKITVKAEREDISLDHAKIDCAPGFEEAVRDGIKKSRTWGWCTVVVTARFKDDPTAASGVDYLGCCSYTSKQDFIDNSGYYEDMVQRAVEDLVDNYEDYCQRLAKMVARAMKVTEQRDLNHAVSILKWNTSGLMLTDSNKN